MADNTGAGSRNMLGRNQKYAGIGDVIKVHIKEAAPDGSVKKGEVHDAVVVRTRQITARMVPICASTATPCHRPTRN